MLSSCTWYERKLFDLRNYCRQIALSLKTLPNQGQQKNNSLQWLLLRVQGRRRGFLSFFIVYHCSTPLLETSTVLSSMYGKSYQQGRLLQEAVVDGTGRLPLRIVRSRKVFPEVSIPLILEETNCWGSSGLFSSCRRNSRWGQREIEARGQLECCRSLSPL